MSELEVTDPAIPLQVVELPVDRLRRLTLIPALPREDLWLAIAAAVTDINERTAALEQEAAATRLVVAELERRASRPVT